MGDSLIFKRINNNKDLNKYRVFLEFCLVRNANKNINLNRLFMDDQNLKEEKKRLFNENGFI